MTVRSFVAWTFYWAGDLWWRFSDRLCRGYMPGSYWLYQRLMCWSDAIQGEGAGPWKDGEPS